MDNKTSENAIESPLSLLPDLSLWGIEEVDKGVCEDTSDNRRIIRDMKARYIPVFTRDGKPTDLIQVITSEMRTAALTAKKSALLVDDRNPDSDYITGIMLIVEPTADHIVPAWVLSATRHWNEVKKKRDDTGTLYRPALIGPPSRCKAKTIDGHRCQKWTNGTVDYGDFCRVHLTNRPNGEEKTAGHLARARNRLQSASEGAVDALEQLMHSAEGESVRLGAARDILDRAGIRGGIEIDAQVVNVIPAADEVRKRLLRLKEGAEAKAELEAKIYAESTDDETGETVYAEVVEEDTEND